MYDRITVVKEASPNERPRLAIGRNQNGLRFFFQSSICNRQSPIPSGGSPGHKSRPGSSAVRTKKRTRLPSNRGSSKALHSTGKARVAGSHSLRKAERAAADPVA